MPFSFPSNPALNATSTQNGREYRYAGNNVWELVAASGGSGSSALVTAASVSAFPASGSASNLYITTEDQRLWRWDATASIYVESGPIGGGFAFASVPASATASGTTGQVATDGSYWYYCSAPNTWVRTALTTWVNFTPATVSGLQLWLDGSDASTLYDATTGGSLVAADGVVKRWQDKSGNARHATESTNGPTRKTAVQNGLGLLRFDGSNDMMTVSGSASSLKFLHGSDSTIFAVYNWTETAQVRAFLMASSFSGGSVGSTIGSAIQLRNDFGSATPYAKLQWVALGTPSGTRVNAYTGDNSFPLSSVGLATISSSVGAATEADRSAVRLNGVVKSKTNAADNHSVSTADSTYDLRIGTEGAASGSFAKADIAEICIYNAALSDTDRAAVEAYLMTKWGIT